MTKFYHQIDEWCHGWLTTVLLIFIEIIFVYILSNIPFILTTLDAPIETDRQIGFWGAFFRVLESEIEKGQLLTFVCTLIAPVFFWSFVEFRKALITKILSLMAAILLAASVYLHARGSEFSYFSSFNLYQAALLIWFLSVLGNRIPPDRKGFFKHTREQESRIMKMINDSSRVNS